MDRCHEEDMDNSDHGLRHNNEATAVNMNRVVVVSSIQFTMVSRLENSNIP